MGTLLGRGFAERCFLLALAWAGSACTITIGPYDDTEGTGPRDTSGLPSLPEPDNAQGEGLESLAYMRVAGQGCTYNVWSRISRAHLETLLDNLRLQD